MSNPISSYFSRSFVQVALIFAVIVVALVEYTISQDGLTGSRIFYLIMAPILLVILIREGILQSKGR